MAARLQALQSKVAEASRLVAKNGCAYYKQTMEKNKKYVVEPPTVEKCQDLSKQLFYTRLARFFEKKGVCPSIIKPGFHESIGEVTVCLSKFRKWYSFPGIGKTAN